MMRYNSGETFQVECVSKGKHGTYTIFAVEKLRDWEICAEVLHISGYGAKDKARTVCNALNEVLQREAIRA